VLDLVIRGGQVVTPTGVGPYDIGIHGEKIVSVTLSGRLDEEAARTIDATGGIVVPGGIEPHCHLAYQTLARPGEQGTAALGPEDDTIGMVFGGVTTMIDFAFVYPGDSVAQSLEERMRRWRGNSFVDYSFHVALCGPLGLDVFDQIPEAVQQGFPSFKAWTCNVLPPVGGRKAFKLDFGRIGLAMEKLARSGGVMSVHGEDDDLLQFNYERFRAEKRLEGWNMAEVHSKLSEALSFRRTIQLAAATGVAVYFVHVSAKEGVEAVMEARANGLPVYAETLHHYACFNAADYKKPRGFCYHTYPSLKFPEDQEALWKGLLGGSISTIATDELPTSLEVKLRGKTIEDMTGGNLGAEARMGVMYSEGVVKRGMSLQRYVDITSVNAAKIFGFYPRKGAIAPDSDADICVMDPSFRKTLTKADFHVSDYSPWEGWDVVGWPMTTVLRGQVMVENRTLVGKLGSGQLIPRKIGAELLHRAAL
jgi:dihydropyrimidinase